MYKRRKKTLYNTILASSIGIDYVIFDFEGETYDITPSELSNVLQILEKIDGSSKIIVTMAARADRFDVHKSHTDLNAFIELSESFDSIGFCLVAGNSAYLSDFEKSKQVSEVVRLCKYISDRNSNSLDIFIGTEKCMNPTLAILRRLAIEQNYKHKYIPFVLKSETSAEEVEMIKQQFNSEFSFALYAPYLYTNSNNGITKKLYDYIIRRKRVKRELGIKNGDIPAFDELDIMTKTLLSNYAEKLSLYGGFSTISNEITNLHKTGFEIVVGLTLNDDSKQILSLKKACLRANELLPA
ncbi:MAG: hypothetical protein ACFFCD_07670 [Promethearchaeota archaeon]